MNRKQIRIMKKYFFIIVTVLISANLNSVSDRINRKADPKLRMNQLKTEMSANLIQNIMPYQTEEVAAPIISEKAKLNKPNIPETVLYDFQTKAGLA